MWAGTATRYGLGGPGIESRWLARFSTPFQTGHGVHPASYTTGTGSFLGVKRTERDVDHTSHLEPKLQSKGLCLFPLWGGLFYCEIYLYIITKKRITNKIHESTD